VIEQLLLMAEGRARSLPVKFRIGWTSPSFSAKIRRSRAALCQLCRSHAVPVGLSQESNM